jgi:acetolactate synthase-1/2/3 large subunit
MTVMTGALAFVQALENNGIDTLFGLPGVQLDHVFDALYQERGAIRVLQTRHEQGAAYMAYGYAESTGRLGAFLVVPGPGLLNAATGICTAHASNAPVLALSGEISRRYIGRGLGVLHELADTPAMLAPVTKAQFFADTPARVPHAINEAVRQATSGRCGPVLFRIPDDVTAERGDVSLGGRAVRDPDPAPDPDLIEKAAALLGKARKPAVFAGGGVFGAEKELLALAEMLEAPVIMTRHGRGALSDRHHLAQTLMGGHQLWPEIDAVLAVGTRFFEGVESWGLDERIKTIRVDIDAMQADKPRSSDIRIVASAKLALAALAGALPRHNTRRDSRKAELNGVKRTALDKLAVLEPQKSYADAIRAAIPEDAIVTTEMTQVGFYTWMGFPVYAPRTLIFPGYQDSLGYGFATALGVKVAHPDRAVVAICGDGGFMFTMPELATAVQHGINVVTIVFNDGGFGNVRRTQKLQFAEHYIGSDLKNPDFMSLAKAFGALGMRAGSPAELRAMLPEAIDARAPVLIECPVGPMPGWQGLMPRIAVRGPGAKP